METDFIRCADNAVEWARTRLDSTEYCLHCLAFVEDALERSNGIEIFGGDCAKESADLYEAHQNTGDPPKGAFVFYDCVGGIGGEHKNWGHVGLSLGDGEVIHAWDRVRIDATLDVEKLQAAPGWESPKYIGWASLERVMQGFQKRTY